MVSDIFSFDRSLDYFTAGGTDLIAYSEHNPGQHQSGLVLIMNDRRIATCGDLRFEPTPGQFQPSSVLVKREFDPESNTLTATLRYPDERAQMKGFNPLIYPDFTFRYSVSVVPEGKGLRITLDLSEPVPERFAGKLYYNLELFPGRLFGKPWIMDDKQGIFPRQPNGPLSFRESVTPHHLPAPEGIHADAAFLTHDYGKTYSPAVADDILSAPYATGKQFTCCPNDPGQRFTLISEDNELCLFDGRMNHNNGWFVLSSPIPSGKTQKVISWLLIPEVAADYRYTPVVQVSQVGYLPGQSKRAFVEMDRRETGMPEAVLERVGVNGPEPVLCEKLKDAGRFMRYRYGVLDFTGIREEGLYRVSCGTSVSTVFRIAEDVLDRGVWQPVLEYFLPVQMCHMRVSEKYRVWHGCCHMDDARMAPVNYNHFDGYLQGPSTMTKYKSGDHVPGLCSGGWHDAGDYDLRVESQSGEAYFMSLIFEQFHVDYDVTAIDQNSHTVEIHQPDGKNDLLQQIEHGLLTVVPAYRSLGRLYRGIICNDLRQYVLLGDASVMTDGKPGNDDDRWVFTENNPGRELNTAGDLAASSVAMRGFNDALGKEALAVAEELFAITDHDQQPASAFRAAVELYLATGKEVYRSFLLSQTRLLSEKPADVCWLACRAVAKINDPAFTDAVREAVLKLQPETEEMLQSTPYGIFYRPRAWGNAWPAESFALYYYFIYKAFPELTDPALISRTLDFILGCHPGSNTASFASGIGAKSIIHAYCANRADWGYIPGGVSSGTELIFPDFPELLEFPFLWEQGEYVLGGGSTRFMFLVLAVRAIFSKK